MAGAAVDLFPDPVPPPPPTSTVPDLFPDPSDVQTQTAAPTIVSRGFRNPRDVRTDPEEPLLESVGGPIQSTLRGAVPFDLTDKAEAAIAATLDRAPPPPAWANRFGPNAGAPGTPMPATPNAGSWNDTYRQKLAAIQQAGDQFAADNPLAAKIAWGAGAVTGPGQVLRLVKPIARATGITPLAERLVGGGLTPKAAETVARTTAPTVGPSLLGQLGKAGTKVAGGAALPALGHMIMPGGGGGVAGLAGEIALEQMGLKGGLHGLKEGGEALWEALKRAAVNRARARLAAGEMPGPAIPEIAPEAPPPYGVPSAPPRPLLEVPPGYRWGEGPTPAGGPSSWGAYRGGP